MRRYDVVVPVPHSRAELERLLRPRSSEQRRRELVGPRTGDLWEVGWRIYQCTPWYEHWIVPIFPEGGLALRPGIQMTDVIEPDIATALDVSRLWWGGERVDKTLLVRSPADSDVNVYDVLNSDGSISGYGLRELFVSLAAPTQRAVTSEVLRQFDEEERTLG